MSTRISTVNFVLARVTLVIVLVLSIATIVKSISMGNAFTSDITAMLPNIDKGIEPELKAKIDRLSEQQFVVLVSAQDTPMANEAAIQLTAALEKEGVFQIRSSITESLDQVKAYFEPYRYQLLSPAQAAALEQSAIELLATNRLEELYRSIQPLSLYSLEQDPFNLGGEWFQSLSSAVIFESTDPPSIIHADRQWFLVAGQATQSVFDFNVQQKMQLALHSVIKHYSDSDLTFLKSGVIFHATEGTGIAKSEMSTVGLGSLIAIIILLSLVFRRWRSFLVVLSVLGISSLVAVASTLLVFEQVSLITLAFGSTLLGLVVDYCFHMLIKYQAVGNGNASFTLVKRGIYFSCITSVVAYLVQLLMPFPGLHQFAVYIAAGLGSSVLTLYVIAGFLPEAQPQPRKEGAACLAFYGGLAKHKILVRIVILLVFIAAAVQLYIAPSSDDVRLLSTSSDETLAEERRVADVLQRQNSQRYFVVSGEDAQVVLKQAEQLSAKLNQLEAENISAISPSSIVPSLAQQRQNYALVKSKLYGSTGALPVLCEKLQSNCDWLAPLPDFNDTLQPELLPEYIQQIFPVLELLSATHAIVMVQGALQDSSAGGLTESNVRYVDRVDMISDVLKQFREGTTYLLFGFILVLAISGIVLFQRRAMMMVSSVVFSSAVALALAFEAGISLFHVLALLLVIGITVDSSAFYLSLGLNRDTWVACSTSALTSIAAFGLLSISSVPVLHQFGMVVFIGLLVSWLSLPIFYHVFHIDEQKQ